jgi:diaminohydroxyphosphoribosylaminopyrimidine deaminase/5-amino-6-(5-phosphoribosylamino)uracil reductase
MTFTAFDSLAMGRALELARRGQGHVEPNPMVGAVIALPQKGGRIVAEGWHSAFGGPHAEVVALAAAGAGARGGTLYVTLEPCCHQGKTPPCTEAIVAAGITRVVVATDDPFPQVAGRGLEALRRAGIAVDVGLRAAEAGRLIAPFRKLVATGRPWVIAKWAMSLDGRLATHPGDDRWISSAESRMLVHELRGRIDAIAVGLGTVLADDPLLTARPAGPRQALRLVFDDEALLPLACQLVRTAGTVPVLVAVGPEAPRERCAALEAAGCEVWRSAAHDRGVRLESLLDELGRRRLTNLLVEGGSAVLAHCFSRGQVDEVWAFVAPRLIGGPAGLPALADTPAIDVEEVSHPGGDILVRGVVRPIHQRKA